MNGPAHEGAGRRGHSHETGRTKPAIPGRGRRRQFLVDAVFGALIGVVVLALIPFDQKKLLLTLSGQSSDAKSAVSDYVSRASTTRRDDVLQGRAKEIAEIRGFKRGVPTLELEGLDYGEGRVRVDGTQVWDNDTQWDKVTGCFQWTGELRIEREDYSQVPVLSLFGGTWYIADGNVTKKRIPQQQAPRGWDCRTPVQKLRDNETEMYAGMFNVSSQLSADHGPANTRDHDIMTAWKDEPTLRDTNDGTWVVYEFPRPTDLVRVDIRNGAGEDSGPNWPRHGRVERFRLETDPESARDNECGEVSIDTTKNRAWNGSLDVNTSKWQVLRQSFGRVCHVWIKITKPLNCEWPGTAISEVRFWRARKREDGSVKRLRDSQSLSLYKDEEPECDPRP